MRIFVYFFGLIKFFWLTDLISRKSQCALYPRLYKVPHEFLRPFIPLVIFSLARCHLHS